LGHVPQYDGLIGSIDQIDRKARFVIGGNIREAEDSIRRDQLVDYVPIDDPEQLRGAEAPEVVVTGTFIARADVQAFYDVFKETGANHRFVR
jgi:hypothetical protein